MDSPNSISGANFRYDLWGLAVALMVSGVLFITLLVVMKVIPFFGLPTILLFVASLSFMVVRSRGTPDLLHPVRLFGALWCFCLALASLRLLSYLSAWDFLTWACLITGLAGFVFGFWIVELRSAHGSASNEKIARDETSQLFLPTRKTLIVACLCVAAGMAVLSYEYHLLGEIPIFADNPDISRFRLFGTADPQFDKLYLKLIHPVVDFIKYGVFLAVIVLCQRKPKSRRVVALCVGLILLGFFALSTQGGRIFLVYIAIPSAVLYHYVRRRVRLIELGAAAMLLFLFLGLAGYFRSVVSQSAPVFEAVRRISNFPEGQFWDGVAFGYGTLTLSYEVFYRLTGDLRNMQHPTGGFLFYSLHRFMPRASLGEITSDLYTGELTTSTYLGDLYGDYSYWGVLFGSIILGMGYGWAYSHAGPENRMYWIYVRALLLQNLIFFPYVNLFSLYLNWMFDLFFMYFLLRYLDPETERSSVGAVSRSPILHGE